MASAWRQAWRGGSARFRRHVVPNDTFVLVGLSGLAVALGVLSQVSITWFPVSTLVLPVVAGAQLLRVRSLWILYGIVAVVVVGEAVGQQDRGGGIRYGTVVVLALVAAISMTSARTRWALGVQGTRGESMLVDLRDRLRAHGVLPRLPAGWEAEVVVRPAGGASFSGDFVVAALTGPGQRVLEIALVDVSGKGVAAGTRSLLLSGAFGGLLGGLPQEWFLPAANSYLLRQRWEEGFATAAQIAIDLPTGEFSVRSAGHPPVAHFVAGSGVWRTTQAEGPLLGVLPDAEFPPQAGVLHPGDALLLYTDGLVEIPGRDLAVGIDRLLGEAERLVPRGFRDGARRLVDAVAAGHADDRALVLLWRH